MKTKWIKFLCNTNANEFSESLLKFPITPNSNFGFDVYSFNDRLSHCSYFEKFTEVLSYTLPSGESIKYEVVKIVSFEFKVFFNLKESLLLCVYEPSKSLKNFIKNLTESTGKQIFVSNIIVDLSHFYSCVRSVDDFADFRVTEITVSNLVFDQNTSAELTIRSRMNAFDLLEEKFSKNNYITKVIKFSFYYMGQKCQIRISKHGSIDFSGDIDMLLPRYMLEVSKSI